MTEQKKPYGSQPDEPSPDRRVSLKLPLLAVCIVSSVYLDAAGIPDATTSPEPTAKKSVPTEKSIASILRKYGHPESQNCSIAYKPRGSAWFDCGSGALQSSETYVAYCTGEDEQTLVIKYEGFDYTDQDGTTVIIPDRRGFPENGQDVCEDRQVTSADRLATRPEVTFTS